jgi:phosphoribosyl-ATP pyrophosphohydrolase
MEKLAEEDPRLAELLSGRMEEIHFQMRLAEELPEAIEHFEKARHDDETPKEVREHLDLLYHWLTELLHRREQDEDLSVGGDPSKLC